MNENSLTKEQLAVQLGLSNSLIDKLRKEGLPSFKIGNKVRFNLEEVNKYLKNMSQNNDK